MAVYPCLVTLLPAVLIPPSNKTERVKADAILLRLTLMREACCAANARFSVLSGGFFLACAVDILRAAACYLRPLALTSS
jgi:hypothetical protein